VFSQAVANQTSATFLRVVGSELIQKYLGDGPRLVRELFRVADDLSPTIVFIGAHSPAVVQANGESDEAWDVEVGRGEDEVGPVEGNGIFMRSNFRDPCCKRAELGTTSAPRSCSLVHPPSLRRLRVKSLRRQEYKHWSGVGDGLAEV